MDLSITASSNYIWGRTYKLEFGTYPFGEELMNPLKKIKD